MNRKPIMVNGHEFASIKDITRAGDMPTRDKAPPAQGGFLFVNKVTK